MFETALLLDAILLFVLLLAFCAPYDLSVGVGSASIPARSGLSVADPD